MKRSKTQRNGGDLKPCTKSGGSNATLWQSAVLSFFLDALEIHHKGNCFYFIDKTVLAPSSSTRASKPSSCTKKWTNTMNGAIHWEKNKRIERSKRTAATTQAAEGILNKSPLNYDEACL